MPPTRSRVSIADQLQLVDADLLLVEREADRRGVLHGVVEQPHVERIDRAVDEQMIEVGQLADDADRAAGDRGGERRQLRHEQADVGIERAVVEAERQLGVGLRRQRDAAGAGEREPRRGGVDLAAELVAAKRQRAGDLADAFLADGQIVDAEPHVVARLSKVPLPCGGELGEARERRPRKGKKRAGAPPESAGRRR